VPSVVTRLDRNVLINQDHPAFTAITCTAPAPVVWDARLFALRLAPK
jgi:RES domain-containing protein